MMRYFLLGIAVLAVLISYGLSQGTSAADSIVTSSKTQNTFQTMETIMASAVNIRNQTGSAPSATYYQSASADFPAIPTDSYTPSNATAYTVVTYTNAYGRPGVAITDSVVHPSSDLTGLPKYTAAGTAPAATCGATDCTLLVVDEHFGRMAH